MQNFKKFFLFKEAEEILESLQTDHPAWQAHSTDKPWTEEEVIASLSKDEQKIIRRERTKAADAKKRGAPASSDPMPPLVLNGQPNPAIFPWLETIKSRNAAITQKVTATQTLPTGGRDLTELVGKRYSLDDIYSALDNLYVLRHIQANESYNATSKYGRMIMGKLIELELVNSLKKHGYNLTASTEAEDLNGIDAWINDPLLGSGPKGLQIKWRSNNNYNILMEMAIVNKDLFRWLDSCEQANKLSGKRTSGHRGFFDKYLASEKIYIKNKGTIPLTGHDMYHTTAVYACLAPFALAAGKTPLVRMRWTGILEYIGELLMHNLLTQTTDWRKQQIASKSGSHDPGDFDAFEFFPRDGKRNSMTSSQRNITSGPFSYTMPNIGIIKIQQDTYDPSFIKIIANISPSVISDADSLKNAMGAEHPSIKYKAVYNKYSKDIEIDPITENIEAYLEQLETMHIAKLRSEKGPSAANMIYNIQRNHPQFFNDNGRNAIKRNKKEWVRNYTASGPNRPPTR